jgi:hypothetical protein
MEDFLLTGRQGTSTECNTHQHYGCENNGSDDKSERSDGSNED